MQDIEYISIIFVLQAFIDSMFIIYLNILHRQIKALRGVR